MLLVETIPLSPPGGGILFTNSQLVKTIPSPPYKKKINHINKIIMTKLSLMHPCLFPKKISICAKNLIQLINSNKFTTTCLIFN